LTTADRQQNGDDDEQLDQRECPPASPVSLVVR
jgi:hypothetical protein